MPKVRQYALSLKQPWACLLVHGLKTIEVRRWPTARLGRILIHAARLADERREAWQHVPEGLLDCANLRGGFLGAAQLIGCRPYRNPEAFAADKAAHLNEDSWFEPAGLYGFLFEKPEVLPFQSYPGWVRFFPVTSAPVVRKAKKPS
ncbi:MAG: ASCH domain-containing protein [Gemmataceae bacterium]|nr:ASCH domain-containing protein [Gemmataceae bacterium]MCI0739199.1 ASCH domain-containing protein [Gemmataceae bacterium]